MVGSIALLFISLEVLFLLYNLAVFILPAFVGFTIGFWAIQTGAGVIGGLAVGVVAGALLFGLGHVALVVSRSAFVRMLIVLLFAIPATYAGYSFVQQIWPLLMPPTVWQSIFGIIVAVSTGVTVVARLSGASTAAAPAARTSHATR